MQKNKIRQNRNKKMETEYLTSNNNHSVYTATPLVKSLARKRSAVRCSRSAESVTCGALPLRLRPNPPTIDRHLLLQTTHHITALCRLSICRRTLLSCISALPSKNRRFVPSTTSYYIHFECPGRTPLISRRSADKQHALQVQGRAPL
jgi:hypothetical protein